jgi:hypothetical protein
LVLAVARLGEPDLKSWWRSHGLDRAGTFVLKRAFPKTWAPAALEIDVLSASRRHHDAVTGRRTAFHLFSDELPFRRWTTAWLAEQKTASAIDPVFADLSSWDIDTARTRLAEWAGEPAIGEAVGDGLLLGRLTRAELDDESTLASTARRLASAYIDQDQPFLAPYFDLAG